MHVNVGFTNGSSRIDFALAWFVSSQTPQLLGGNYTIFAELISDWLALR